LIGAKDKTYGIMMEPATLLYMYDYYNPETDGIKVEGNVG
jgi:hypothetical protein